MRRNFFHLHPGLNEQVLHRHLCDLDDNEIEVIERQLSLGVPLAYLLGHRYFYRAEFSVDERVLIPRMESEMILELLQARITPAHQTLVDVGTGSGCLGLSCAMEFTGLKKVILTDISPEALEVALCNREKLSYRIPPHCQVQIHRGDCLKDIPRGDIIVANPPYIKSSARKAVHPQTVRHEPHQALFISGDEKCYWRWFEEFFDRVCESIERGGVFVMEGETGTLLRIKELLGDRSAVAECHLKKDLVGRDRFVCAQF